LKSIQRRGTAAYYTQKYRQARKDFMHSLTLEFSAQFVEYLKIVNEKIANHKKEAHLKLKRKVLFNAGVDFYGDGVEGLHPDDAKKRGGEDFKRQGRKIEITEMNLDMRLLKEIQAGKDKVLKAQGNQKDDFQSSNSKGIKSIPMSTQDEDEEEVVGEEKKPEEKKAETESDAKKDKKKKKKKKNKKGLADFMDDFKETERF